MPEWTIYIAPSTMQNSRIAPKRAILNFQKESENVQRDVYSASKILLGVFSRHKISVLKNPLICKYIAKDIKLLGTKN